MNNGNNGSKLPMESRPLRLTPEVAQVVEARLAPLKGQDLARAQDAVLKVYQSGKQQAMSETLRDFVQAIDLAVKEK